jgi:hypothetical protein
MCKIYEGMQSTLFSKLVMENFESSLSMNVTSPYSKNTIVKLTNCSITEKFLPPMAIERRVKLEVESLGTMKGKRLILFKSTPKNKHQKLAQHYLINQFSLLEL